MCLCHSDCLSFSISACVYEFDITLCFYFYPDICFYYFVCLVSPCMPYPLFIRLSVRLWVFYFVCLLVPGSSLFYFKYLLLIQPSPPTLYNLCLVYTIVLRAGRLFSRPFVSWVFLGNTYNTTESLEFSPKTREFILFCGLLPIGKSKKTFLVDKGNRECP